MSGTFGDFFKGKRIAAGYTLRRFCAEFGFDPGNISKLERGLLQPSDAKLAEYARCLVIQPGSQDWQEFHDLAATSKGRLPADILDDTELVAKLPLVYRTIRNEKPTSEQLDNLIEIVRKTYTR